VKLRPTLDGHVLRITNSSSEMTVDIRLVEYNGFVNFFERLLDNVMLNFNKAIDVLIVS